jgi:NTE family protein
MRGPAAPTGLVTWGAVSLMPMLRCDVTDVRYGRVPNRGAGLSRILLGNSTTGLLLGAAAGGLAGNMTLDRQAEERRRQEAEAARVAAAPIKVFVTATNVRTGRGRVFRNDEVTADALLASACLPTMFQAIEIDGESYWDGGYSGNPTLTPLIRDSEASDIVLVAINPVQRPGTPRTARDILNRLNEVSFNAVLIKELRMLALMRRLLKPEDPEAARWADVRMHLINSPMMTELGYSSKLNAEWAFLEMLRAEGRRCAERFLDDHGDNVGARSSVDIDILLEGV